MLSLKYPESIEAEYQALSIRLIDAAFVFNVALFF